MTTTDPIPAVQDCLTLPTEREATALSTLAHGLVGSEILKI